MDTGSTEQQSPADSWLELEEAVWEVVLLCTVCNLVGEGSWDYMNPHIEKSCLQDPQQLLQREHLKPGDIAQREAFCSYTKTQRRVT